MTVKKELYTFVLENRSDNRKKRFEIIGRERVNVYYDKYGEDSKKTNAEIVEMLYSRYNGATRWCSNCIELENGDRIGWQPANSVQ